jgi:hypothetical protein
MRLDASGNLGLGVTPSAWGSIAKAIEFSAGSIESRSTAFSIWANGYYDGAAPKYVANGFASNYYQFDGQHIWLTAPSGTAGNAITFTQAMTLNASGRLGIGTTTPNRRLTLLVSPASSNDEGINVFNGSTRFLFVRTGSPYTYRGVPANAGMIYSETNIALLADGANITFHNGNGEVARISTSGNVGIGTTTDSGYKLDVNGTSRFSGVLSLNTNTNYVLWGTNAAVNPYIQGGSDNSLYIGTGNNSRLTIAPTGAATFSSSVAATTTFTLNGTKNIFLRSNQSGVAGLLSGSSLAYEGNFSIYTDTGISGEILGMYYWNGSTYKSALQVANVSSGNSDLILMKDGGNVGIGTTAPFSDTNYVSTYIGGATGGQLILGNSTGGAANRFMLLQGDSTASYMLSIGSRPLIFFTNGGERMRITSGGSVNMTGGTLSDPVLVVNGNTSATISGNAKRLAQFRYNTGDSTGIDIGYDATAGNGVIAGGTASAGAGIDFWTYNGSAWSSRALLTKGGNLLLGTTTDNGERLYVSGAIRATGNITANSDLVLKKNLTLVDNPIDKLNQLNGYLYQWKENDEYQYGVIAQEVEKILPHAVQTGNNGIKGVAYNQLIPLLIEVAKEQNKKIVALEAKLG